jgi:release factor glutamine methyltransferase
MSQAQLIVQNDYVLTEKEYQDFVDSVAQLKSGMPISYLLGYKEFYSRQFKVSPATLIPRPETELLVEAVLLRAESGQRVLDLGTGSGCIAITLKLENPSLQLTATDYYVQALTVAQQNAHELGADVTFILSNWYAKVPGNFNLIVSNPPYIAHNDNHLAALEYEPLHALTDFADGLKWVHSIVTGAVEHLIRPGWLLIEHGFDQGLAVRKIFAQAGFTTILTLPDYAGLDRITLGQLI